MSLYGMRKGKDCVDNKRENIMHIYIVAKAVRGKVVSAEAFSNAEEAYNFLGEQQDLDDFKDETDSVELFETMVKWA